ncbi:YcxB family protein [Flavobacterium sp. Root186]|uniref:YcxB family protein n=1 Tax=Flavobacterium sp. Root186 TaxID=1736485 RepID=UPI0006FF6483|nr:hypothetical protein ASD98_02295 [Flavobacterium sp. Root186]
MNTSNFSLEFRLNADEVRKLNKMYFKNLYKERVRILFGFVLLFSIFYDFSEWNNGSDLIIWIIRNLTFVIIFLMLQCSFVNMICKLTFQLIKKLLRFDRLILKYKFNFTNSFIYVHSPLGEFVHKWTQIEKAILTKDFFYLYIKEKNGYIISISNKNQNRDIKKLIAFIESNVIQITKV